MIRAVPAEAALGHAVEELLVIRVGPLLDVEPAAEPEPRRVDHVPVFLEEIELLLEREGAAVCVGEPARARRQGLAAPRERDLVVLVPELDVLDGCAAEQVDPRLEGLRSEEVLEPAAVELVAGDVRFPRRPSLDALREVCVVTRGEPEAQTALADVLVLQVLPEAEDFAEVVAGHLLGRLSDLERSLGRIAVAPLRHEDAGLGPCLLDLQPERQPSEAAAEDRNVIYVGRLAIVVHARVGS